MLAKSSTALAELISNVVQRFKWGVVMTHYGKNNANNMSKACIYFVRLDRQEIMITANVLLLAEPLLIETNRLLNNSKQ